jgi:hypothetical protein
MAVVLTLRWQGVTRHAYDELLKAVDWEGRPAAGGIFHVAWFDEEGMSVVDVWESQQAFEAFMNDRLGPVVQRQVEGEPEIAFHDAHRYFNAQAAHADAAA